MGKSQLLCGSHMEAIVTTFLVEHLCSNARVHPKPVNATRENLQPLKVVGSAGNIKEESINQLNQYSLKQKQIALGYGPAYLGIVQDM